MKKNYIYQSLGLLCFVILLFACSKQTSNEATIIDVNYISPEKAAIIAVGNAKKLIGKSTSAEAPSPIKKVKSTFAVQSNDNVNVFYMVNFEDNGFAIISADRRTPSVLAYSNNGKLDSNNNNPGLNLWLAAMKKEISEVRQKNIAYKNQDKSNLIPLIKTAQPALIAGKELSSPPIEEECEDYIIQYGPFLQTTWGQGIGYNNSMPVATGCVDIDRYFTGCNATAMAQIMRYYEYPSTYNYSIMPNNIIYLNSGADEISYLMRDAGIDVFYSYSCSVTLGFPNLIPGSMTSRFGYAQGGIYNSTNYLLHTRNSLADSRPVILTATDGTNGPGHTWVCDGSIEYYQFVQGDCSANVSSYLHMNWGWDNGYQNGWFSVTNFATPVGNFMTNINAIIRIHPTNPY